MINVFVREVDQDFEVSCNYSIYKDAFFKVDPENFNLTLTLSKELFGAKDKLLESLNKNEIDKIAQMLQKYLYIQ